MQSIDSDKSMTDVRTISPKSGELTYFLCLILGSLGIHRFYVGKIWTGLLMLLTVGGLGLWVLVDLMFIVNNKFEDKQKNIVILTKKPSLFKRTLIIVSTIILWLVLSVGGFFIVIFYLTSGMVDVARLQLQALSAGDTQKAYSYTSSEFQKVTPYSRFEQFVSAYPILTQQTDTSFLQRKIENNGGTISGVLIGKDGTETPVEFSFVKEDDQWKITSIVIYSKESKQ